MGDACSKCRHYSRLSCLSAEWVPWSLRGGATGFQHSVEPLSQFQFCAVSGKSGSENPVDEHQRKPRIQLDRELEIFRHWKLRRNPKAICSAPHHHRPRSALLDNEFQLDADWTTCGLSLRVESESAPVAGCQINEAEQG